MSEMSKRFDVGKITYGDRFIFNGCEIVRDNYGNMRMSMKAYNDCEKY